MAAAAGCSEGTVREAGSGSGRCPSQSFAELADVPFKVVPDLDDKDKEALAVSLNQDRRQLTQEELTVLRQERIERAVELRSEGASLRDIAEEEGVSVAQV